MFGIVGSEEGPSLLDVEPLNALDRLVFEPVDFDLSYLPLSYLVEDNFVLLLIQTRQESQRFEKLGIHVGFVKVRHDFALRDHVFVLEFHDE